MHSELSSWYAIQVRSRCEKLAAAELSLRGHEVFPAIAAQRRIWADRVRVVNMPFFPGYIFGRFQFSARMAVESVPGVASVVRFGNQGAAVNDKEIESVRLVIGSGIEAIRSPHLRVGLRVRVLAGPLKGAEGILSGWKGRHQLSVSVDILQRSVSVEIDEAMVEPIPRATEPPLRAMAAGAA